jgi:hypothetical protein
MASGHHDHTPEPEQEQHPDKTGHRGSLLMSGAFIRLELWGCDVMGCRGYVKDSGKYEVGKLF